MSERETLVGVVTALTPEDHIRRFQAERTLERMGYTYQGGSWVAPLGDVEGSEGYGNPYAGCVFINSTMFPPGVSLEAAEQYMRDKYAASEGAKE